MGSEYQVLRDTVAKAESDIILFFVILAVILIMFIIPLYAMILKDRKGHREIDIKRIEAECKAANDRHDKFLEREQTIIQVVKENTEVIAGLKAVFERDSNATRMSLERIHSRIDQIGEAISNVNQRKS